MCGKFELKTNFEKLPTVLKQDYPYGLDTKYQTQNLNYSFIGKDMLSNQIGNS